MIQNSKKLPMDLYTLIMISLGCNHDISLIQNKNFELRQVEEFVSESPIRNFSRSPDDYVLLDGLPSWNFSKPKTTKFNNATQQLISSTSSIVFVIMMKLHTGFLFHRKNDRDFWAELAHGLDNFSRLYSQLISGRKAQHLGIVFGRIDSTQHRKDEGCCLSSSGL
jgi:hypothetical protein